MYEINIENLNKLLILAYELGRENENRTERGIPELDVQEEFKKFLTTVKNSV